MFVACLLVDVFCCFVCRETVYIAHSCATLSFASRVGRPRGVRRGAPLHEEPQDRHVAFLRGLVHRLPAGAVLPGRPTAPPMLARLPMDSRRGSKAARRPRKGAGRDATSARRSKLTSRRRDAVFALASSGGSSRRIPEWGSPD